MQARRRKLMSKLGIVVLLSMMASAAWAQIPTRGNVFFGYSFDRTSIVSNDTTNLNGWEATLEGKFLPWIGLVVDVDGHYGSHNFDGTNADISANNILFGPRVSLTVKRFRPFGEFLAGFGHISRSNGISIEPSRGKCASAWITKLTACSAGSRRSMLSTPSFTFQSATPAPGT